MTIRLTMTAAFTTACASLAAVSCAPADAADGCPSYACVTGHGDVTVHASHGGSGGTQGGAGGTTATGASDIVQNCKWHGEPVSCTGGFGTTWSNAYQCFVKALGATDPANPPNDRPIRQAPPSGAAAGDGEWYGCQINNLFTLLWLASPPLALPSPGELAQDVVATMRLTPITIGMVPKDRPGYVGVIGLPVWMWVRRPSPSTYGPITASATAGPMTVTATGRVTSID